MKINDVTIENWEAPGKEWWEGVERRPDEPLIEATMKLTLSWNEYDDLIKRNNVVRLNDLTLERVKQMSLIGDPIIPPFEAYQPEWLGD